MDDVKLGRVVRQSLVLTGLWTLPVIIATVGGVMVRSDGMPASHIVWQSFAMWYIWVPVTPLILAAHGRFPLSRRQWLPAVVVHSAIVTGVFVAQCWLTVVVGHATRHVPDRVDFSAQLESLMPTLLPYDFFVYAAVMAVAIGIELARMYHDRDLRASQLETQLERSRLDALQSQLQPHFLFNALNSVTMLVRRDRKHEALDVVVGFSELLRYVLDEAGTIDVPLEEELFFIRRYLDIERVRHQERLNVEYDIEPGTERASVPNLLLQPLVENAIKHGINRTPEGGSLRIAAVGRAGMLRIEVENDGPAVPTGFSLERTPGLGLRNLRERLNAIVGPEASLTISPGRTGAGALVVVELPFRIKDVSRPMLLELAG